MPDDPLCERMPSQQTLKIRHLRGRYPYLAGVLDGTNIEASVEQIDGGYRIRLDDCRPGHADFWLEIALEIPTEVTREGS